ncbi:MAG TPA: cupin domain-containing protein [Kofleriaceae bacterium]|nr:cupin domain-containing protein [Kofleriaceae bacterium]
MEEQPASHVRGAEVIVPCTDLDAAMERLEPLGFRLESVFPADEPAVAVVAGHGLRLRLDRGAATPAPVVRLLCREPQTTLAGARALTLPGGARLELVAENEEFELPPPAPSYTVSHARGAAAWRDGRAGMLYRDLIPDRQGGRFIASHIRVPDGGPVPDYVHYHLIVFQLIYCHRGWVRVVYEDQGEPFVMEPGDCVLQPPRIRHRVLECSPGLEVLELTSPARHETRAEHEMVLPLMPRTNLPARSPRSYDGQRFLWHRAADARWEPAAHAGWQARDLGIAAATAGLAGAHVLRPTAAGARLTHRHGGELLWGCILRGAATLDGEHRLEEADAFTVPAGRSFELADATADLEWLLVAVP